MLPNMSLLCFAAYKSIDERDNNNLVDCNFDELKPGQGQYCKVKANDLMKESCTHETNYGFETGTPCLLLKLNRVSHQGPAGARGHICELVLFISKLLNFFKFVNDITVLENVFEAFSCSKGLSKNKQPQPSK